MGNGDALVAVLLKVVLVGRQRGQLADSFSWSLGCGTYDG
jgi:hypothetical protein